MLDSDRQGSDQIKKLYQASEPYIKPHHIITMLKHFFRFFKRLILQVVNVRLCSISPPSLTVKIGSLPKKNIQKVSADFKKRYLNSLDGDMLLLKVKSFFNSFRYKPDVDDV